MKNIILLCVAVIAAYPTTAFAAPERSGDGLEKIAVSFSDLDLRSAVGQNRLKGRIAYAAYRLCLVEEPASPSPMFADPVCLRETIANGMEQLNRVIARSGGTPSPAALAANPAR